MVTLYIENARCKVEGLKDERIIRELDKHLSYTVQSYQFMKYSKPGWDGRYRLFNKRSGYYPVGLTQMVENILKANRVRYQVIDNRDSITYGKSLGVAPGSVFVARDYQKAAVNAAIKAGSGIRERLLEQVRHLLLLL